MDSWNEIRSAAERAVRQGRFDDAGKLWVQAAALCSELDRYDGRRVVTLEGLANVYWHTNKFADALPILETTFAIHEEQLGPDHADIGVLANNLARLYHTLGRLPEGEQMYKRALRIQRKSLGLEHPDVVELIKNYGNLLVAAGKHFEAEDLKASTVSVKSGVWNRSGYFKTIQIDSQDSLFSHSDPTASNQLQSQPAYNQTPAAASNSAPAAMTPNNTNGWSEAPVENPAFGSTGFDFVPPRVTQLPNKEAFELGALLANDAANSSFAQQSSPELAPSHAQSPPIQAPSTAASPATPQSADDAEQHNEAQPSTISDAEKSAESNDLSAWLSARKAAPSQVSAQEKPEQWIELFHKAMNAMQQNNTLQAEQILKRAVTATEEFAPTDQRTASTLELYSEALWKNGKLAEAEPVCERTLYIYSTALEPDHQDIGVVANNLAMLYHALDKPEKAEPLYKRSLAIRSKNQGASHPDVVMLLNNYANMLYNWHREGEAVNLKNHIRSLSSGKWNQVGKFKALNPAELSQTKEEQSQTFSRFMPSMEQALLPTKESEDFANRANDSEAFTKTNSTESEAIGNKQEDFTTIGEPKVFEGRATEDALTRFSASEASNYNNDPRAVLKNLVDGFKKKSDE